ncbi:hypothetical protein DSL92_03895 [Billgrantia gudaonensis]|uniref:MmyB-like transcription regulator ligand binding domain-containing protein n=1 Tax=Billgrantia gudaonensis TaxID=376427 RepID=A0A432JKD0_9GAMM|nr:hypothetical protein DSL92_03895 [Halomonas gudaonensis]
MSGVDHEHARHPGLNRAATVIHGDLHARQGIERNSIHGLFLNPRMRSMLLDWEAHARLRRQPCPDLRQLRRGSLVQRVDRAAPGTKPRVRHVVGRA